MYSYFILPMYMKKCIEVLPVIFSRIIPAQHTGTCTHDLYVLCIVSGDIGDLDCMEGLAMRQVCEACSSSVGGLADQLRLEDIRLCYILRRRMSRNNRALMMSAAVMCWEF